MCFIWNSLYRFLGIIHFPTTSFQHQSNCLAERFYCRLKMSLRALLSGADWFQYVSLVLVSLHSVPREDSAMLAFEAIFGSLLVHNQDFHHKSLAVLNEIQVRLMLSNKKHGIMSLTLILESIICSDPPCKDGISQFTTVPFKP